MAGVVQQHVLAIALCAGGSDPTSLDHHGAASVGDQTGGVHRLGEGGVTGAVDGDCTQLVDGAR